MPLPRVRLSVRLLMLAVASVALLLWLILALSPERFDRASWLTRHHDFSPERHGMADDLIGQRLLLGKTRAEVLDLLGPERSFYKTPLTELVYKLGNNRGFGLDCDWLRVQFGPNGKAMTAEIISD